MIIPTQEQRARILVLTHELRKIAHRGGVMHSFWDVILDMEAFVNLERTVVQATAEEWITLAEKLLEERAVLT